MYLLQVVCNTVKKKTCTKAQVMMLPINDYSPDQWKHQEKVDADADGSDGSGAATKAGEQASLPRADRWRGRFPHYDEWNEDKKRLSGAGRWKAWRPTHLLCKPGQLGLKTNAGESSLSFPAATVIISCSTIFNQIHQNNSLLSPSPSLSSLFSSWSRLQQLEKTEWKNEQAEHLLPFLPLMWSLLTIIIQNYDYIIIWWPS